ncbi:hypothetical protein SFRURICE_005915 [Spodoptera frugiperda]|nr:hypothetical protein SFRURICE_005915 [Spodoptera frugiperda]
MSTTHSNIGGEFVLTSPALGGARGSCRILLLKEGKQPPRAANFRVGTTLLGPSVVGSLGLILAGQQAMVAGDGQAITEARSVSRRLEREYSKIFTILPH